jgi:hypothetical protein
MTGSQTIEVEKRERGMGNREQGTGNREQEIGITHPPLNLGASPYQPTIELAAYIES